MTPRDCLTCKEIEVATLVWQGLTNREIGKLTGTTEQVVKNHLRCAFDKLGVWSRLELAMYVASHGGKSWAEEATRPPASGTVLPETRSTATSRTTQLSPGQSAAKAFAVGSKVHGDINVNH